MGDAYRVLGELDRAAEAYSAALALWRTYGYGEMPAASLAAVYVEQGRVDEAIAVCEEYMPEGGDAAIRQVLEEARRRQAGGAPSPVRGCRLVHLPFRHPGEPPPQRGVAPADG
jgi:tetratricopeptide (TPR) repeat protein